MFHLVTTYMVKPFSGITRRRFFCLLGLKSSSVKAVHSWLFYKTGTGLQRISIQDRHSRLFIPAVNYRFVPDIY